ECRGTVRSATVGGSGSPTTTSSRTTTERSRGIDVITAFGISTAAPTAAPTVPPTIAPTGPAASPPLAAPSAAPWAVVDWANAAPGISSVAAINETDKRLFIASYSLVKMLI